MPWTRWGRRPQALIVKKTICTWKHTPKRIGVWSPRPQWGPGAKLLAFFLIR